MPSVIRIWDICLERLPSKNCVHMSRDTASLSRPFQNCAEAIVFIFQVCDAADIQCMVGLDSMRSWRTRNPLCYSAQDCLPEHKARCLREKKRVLKSKWKIWYRHRPRGTNKTLGMTNAKYLSGTQIGRESINLKLKKKVYNNQTDSDYLPIKGR